MGQFRVANSALDKADQRELGIRKDKIDAQAERDICSYRWFLANAPPVPACEKTYRETWEKLNEDSTNSQAQNQKDGLICKGDTSCQEAARVRFDQRTEVNRQARHNAEATRDNCKKTSPTLKVGLCVQNEPSLVKWNRLFTAQMQQEWVKQTSSVTPQQFPYGFSCRATYKVTKTQDTQETLITDISIAPTPCGYEGQLRYFLNHVPVEALPATLMPGGYVEKSSKFSCCDTKGLKRGPFTEDTTTYYWPTPSQ